MIASMTVAGFAIRRIFPVTPSARNVGAGLVLLLIVAWIGVGLFKAPAPTEAATVLAAQQSALAQYVAHDIEYKLTERTDMLSHMASAMPLALLDHPAQLRRWLGEQQPALFTQGIVVTDANGRTVAEYTPRTERTTIRHAERDYLNKALAGSTAIGRPVSGRLANEPILPIATPVKDASDKVRAVLVGMTALHAPGFLTLNPQNSDDESTDFMLVAPQDQLLLASTQAKQVLQPTPAAGVDAVLDRAMGGFRGTAHQVNAEGVEEVMANASIPSAGWFVLARHADPVALRTPFAIGLGRLISIAAVLLLLTASWLAWQHRSALAHPLNRLARWMDRRRSGTTAIADAAYHDTLTGLPNAALLADRLGQTLARAQRNGARVGLLHINLDQFTALNENLGMEAGNAALVEIGRRLAAIVRETDTLARVQGDTFVILLGELDSGLESAKISACAVAAKCLDAVAPPLTLNATPYQLGASVGIALSEGQTDANALQSTAARAMYHAKQVGGDRYFVGAAAAMPANPAMANA